MLKGWPFDLEVERQRYAKIKNEQFGRFVLGTLKPTDFLWAFDMSNCFFHERSGT